MLVLTGLPNTIEYFIVFNKIWCWGQIRKQLKYSWSGMLIVWEPRNILAQRVVPLVPPGRLSDGEHFRSALWLFVKKTKYIVRRRFAGLIEYV